VERRAPSDATPLMPAGIVSVGLWRRRLWALAAVGLTLSSAGLALAVSVARFPRGLSVLLCLFAAVLAAWYAVRRRGARRSLSAAAAGLALAGAVAVIIVEGHPLADLIVAATLCGALLAARRAFRTHVRLAPAVSPRHPVLVYNPLSGGGKSERFHLVEEARTRGIEAIELRHGDDLEELVLSALLGGADGLAMAGGDGSQAIVAKVAAQAGLPYACIPAGTRNHFALDLGVDREDVVGALDAFVEGGERRVDLAEVNGRVFVNNVSLGLYADAVQREEYRDAKLRTLMSSVPDALGQDWDAPKLHWLGPAGGESGAAVLISNNSYRLSRMIGSGTRPRLDRGELGVAVVSGSRTERPRHEHRLLETWSVRRFEVDSSVGPVAAGIDGEATLLEPPLRFRTLPGALRVRLALRHPGASPSFLVPDTPWQVFSTLVSMALTGRPPQPV
jgi:diacylglycerol kinase family enzyme